MTLTDNLNDPPLGLGPTSVALGVVGLLLLFLPVLSVPLGAIGLAFGLAGLLLALFGGWASLRWSIAGIALSGLALAIAVAIAEAAAGPLPSRPAPPETQAVAEHVYVPPPARPYGWEP